MELILQTGLEHQQKAVDALGNIFEDIPIWKPAQFYENPSFDIYNYRFIDNIRQQQKKNNLHPTLCKQSKPTDDCLNLDIKMETGTGKTYVYTHTIFELHKRLGVNKFIIAVPSLPIKAGTQQFIGDAYVQKHFQNTCGYNASIELCVVKPVPKKKGKSFFPSTVRAFVDGSFQNTNKIYVLLVNMQLLTNGNLLSRSDYDYGVQGFYRPFDAIKATKPIVIIDEPHRFQRTQTAYQKILDELKPQCIIRFGATFPEISIGKGKTKINKKDYLNLLYDLNACDAFNQNLIKGVAKEHFEPLSSANEKVKIVSIENKSSVTVKHISQQASSRSFTLQKGDSFSIVSEELSGLSVLGVGNGFVELSNGQEKRTGEEFTVDVFSESYQEQMLKLALQRHFETERENFNRPNKLKTLALFFIDNIESYRGNSDGEAWLKEMFERLLRERLQTELEKTNTDEYNTYLKKSLEEIPLCHAGYFAQDNADSDEGIAQEIDDILHNKKKLLSIVDEKGVYNPRRFLFSKWTLKEGWDNPNIFTIVKLRSSGSDNSKIQEVGRGLRLPVDEYGNRIANEEFMLNYIVDFTEADFANQLVAEINGELPGGVITSLSNDELERVATLLEMDAMQLMMELYNKKYITDTKLTLNQSFLDDFYNEYPQFNVTGISGSKVIDKNKKVSNTIKVRKAQFEEIKELWITINQKYVLFFQKEVNDLIKESLPKLLENNIFGDQEMRSIRQEVRAGENQVEVISDPGVAYVVQGRILPYNVFLKRINKATSIPITILHQSICIFSEKNKLKPSYINEASMARLIKEFNDWKGENLMGRFNYKQTQYTPLATGLTNNDGTVKDEVVQGSIGIHVEKGNVSERYLYDAIAYDSALEKKNIIEDIQEVIVYGKIPRKSIAIPTIANSSYSPDFMYVVKKSNGQKELNIVVETKDVENKTELRGTEKIKIKCAKVFFEQLTLNGYSVSFKEQLNNKGMATIINELLQY